MTRLGDLAGGPERKLDRICRKLELGPNDHLLEIGSGWGSFALHAAARYGSRVTTATISREQHARAVQRIHEAGLQDRVEVLLSAYRDLRGRYDKLVSIEMIELLSPGGLMLLQAIVIDDLAYDVEKASRSFIREVIFPSGCLPSLGVISRCVDRATDLRVLDVEDITAHYPKTLRRWRTNFVAAAELAEQLGFDRRFRRLWELYFSYCEGGFRERRIGAVQTLLAKPSVKRPAAWREPGALVAGS
jgi:cyclopropane-fatty-acyl-phospholipid synthase